MHEMLIVEEVVSMLAQKGYEWIVKKFTSSQAKLEFTSSAPQLTESLTAHLNEVCNWSMESSFNFNRTSKQVSQIYVALNFYLTPKRTHLEQEESIKIELSKVFDSDFRNLIILGSPGAGKTTSMKYVCQRLLYDNEFYKDKFTFPLVVRLRDLNSSKEDNSLFSKLANILGLSFGVPKDQEEHKKDQTTHYNLIRDSVTRYIDGLRCILILDGFDELSSVQHQQEILGEIRHLFLNLNAARVILTSRTGEFPYHLEKSNIYEIAALTPAQIKEFISNWLGDRDKSASLYLQIQNSPFFDTTVRPLTLAHLCAIYEKSGKIPEKPKTVYELVINLMLKDWNEQWLIKRNSKYSQFEPERKAEFLSQLAYLLTTKYSTTTFTRALLRECYNLISDNFGLPKEQVSDVVDELESHTGLLLQSGFESFEFAHKSLQEYLSARYINGVPSPTRINFYEKMPNELAVATAISINPTHYFYYLTKEIFIEAPLSIDFISVYLSRLSLEKPDFTISALAGISLMMLAEKFYLKEVHVGKDGEEKAGPLKEKLRLICTIPIIHQSLAKIKDFLKHGESITLYLANGGTIEFEEYIKIADPEDVFAKYTMPKRILIPGWLHQCIISGDFLNQAEPILKTA